MQGSEQQKRVIAEAQERIDAGLGLGGRGVGVHVKIAQRALEQRQAEDARLADPVEQAKTRLRRRYSPVVGAEFLDPPGPKGKFLVGRKLVTEQELLEMAKGMVV